MNATDLRWGRFVRAGVLGAVLAGAMGIAVEGLAAPAVAQDGQLAQTAAATFEDGLRAYDAGDHAGAAAAWERAAEAGDMAAMRNLGHLYRWGRGVPRDPRMAAEWYQRAAVLGFDRAQVNLAALYLAGEGVTRNVDHAMTWYGHAAEQGNAGAQVALARLLLDGDEVPRDVARAQALLRQAEASGHAEAAPLLRVADALRGAAPTVTTPAEAPEATMETPKVAEPAPEPAPEPEPEPEPAPAPEPEPAPAPAPAPAPEPAPEPEPEPDSATAPAETLPGTTGTTEEPRLIARESADGWMAHLGAYRTQAQADAAWQALAGEIPDLAVSTAFVMPGYVPDQGDILRLYAEGERDALRTLCQTLRGAGRECEVHRFFR